MRNISYWIFKCDREKYELDARLQDVEEETTWRIDLNYKNVVQPGDMAFIWQIGRNKGIRAIMVVVSKPDEIEEIENEKQYYRPNFEPTRILRVRGKFLSRFPVVSAKRLRENDPSLSDSPAFRGRSGQTTYEVTNTHGNFLENYIKAVQ